MSVGRCGYRVSWATTIASMNVPNALATTRILLTPVVMALVLFRSRIDNAYAIAALVFFIAALTDFADGYLARRWQITSTLGAFLDSVADKILMTGSILVLVEVDRAWSWAAFVLIGREFLVMGLRGVAALSQAKVPPSFWGKLKTNLQFLAIGLALVRGGSKLGLMFLDEWVLSAAVIATIASGWDYFRHSGVVLRPD